MKSDTILVIGASGQIGTELTLHLRNEFKASNIIASDIKQPSQKVLQTGPFEIMDVTDEQNFAELLSKHHVTQVYNLAALLSASSEKKPKLAWKVNMTGLLNSLDLAVQFGVKKIFWPSSIAVFGPDTPKHNTPQNTVMNPTSVYGISKLAGERWMQYYYDNHDLDTRSIRYPGLISYRAEPGGGTTDYAVNIFYDAIEKCSYESFLAADTTLPMMYMPDAIRATVELMEAPKEQIKVRSSYNVAAMSFSPEQIGVELAKHFPEFQLTYNPDFRQKLADTWPQSIDDSVAQKQWNWDHRFDLASMTVDMLKHIKTAVPSI
jgi:nucleoside-diphosphate-sugar epimerase